MQLRVARTGGAASGAQYGRLGTQYAALSMGGMVAPNVPLKSSSRTMCSTARTDATTEALAVVAEAVVIVVVVLMS